MKILSISTVFPNPQEPNHGTFVRARLRELGKLTELKVVAPVSLVDYAQGRASNRWFASRGVPKHRWEGDLEVFHPRWFHPVGSGGWSAVWLFVQLILPLLRIRSKYRFEILDAHFGFPEGIATALLAIVFQCRFCVTLRGSETMHSEYGFRRLLLGWALRRAERVITVSRPLRDFAISLRAAASRIVIIPNGVETSVFYPRDRADVRRQHGIAAEAVLVISAGHLIELKGHHRVVHALHQLSSRKPPELIVVGKQGKAGPFEKHIRKTVSDLGMWNRVRFLGEVPPQVLAELMSASDVLCLASTREGWPNVVNEALACGTPVVCTEVGGAQELLPSTELGLVVAVNEPGQLAAALNRALQHRWDHSSIAAFGQSRSWTRVAQEIFVSLGTDLPSEGKDARVKQVGLQLAIRDHKESKKCINSAEAD